jgi:hypothetical protein
MLTRSDSDYTTSYAFFEAVWEVSAHMASAIPHAADSSLLSRRESLMSSSTWAQITLRL